MELTKIYFFFEKVSHSIVNGSVLVRYWFGDFIHGSGFGSAEPKNPGSVVHYLIGQKLVENAKTEKFKCDILADFQTLCLRLQAKRK